MENIEIARILDDVSHLLEIQGANPFRIRAYENAARVIESHTVAMRTMVEQGDDLTELPSIGKDMAKYITELVETGKLSVLEQIAEEIPLSLIELTRLPGVGAKKARALWETLGVETIDDLDAAARAGRVAELKGFGKKTEQRIVDGIAAYRKRQEGRIRLADAERLIAPLLGYLRELPALQRLDVAGSFRRRRETVRDIDLLAIAADAESVMAAFTDYPEARSVEKSGPTRGTIILTSGLQVDLRILPEESYGAALQYFTGSKEHNVRFRKRAVSAGLRVSEYGVFRVDDDTPEGDPLAGVRVAGDTEESVYAAVDLPWIAPELREDRGEIDAAQHGQLPTLVTLDDIRGDLQMHSVWSDGKDTIEAMLKACVDRGYEYFAMTDHSKALAMTGGLDRKRLIEQWGEVEALQARYENIRILKSMEIDILADGTLDLDDDLVRQLDVVVVSIHSRLDLPAGEQTERILTALRHPCVDLLAHPTGRLINRRDPMRFDVDEVLQAAAALGVVVELNAHPERLDLKDTQLMRAKELGVRIAINTDAHSVDDLSLMRFGIDQARRGWLEPSDVWNCASLESLLASRRPRPS